MSIGEDIFLMPVRKWCWLIADSNFCVLCWKYCWLAPLWYLVDWGSVCLCAVHKGQICTTLEGTTHTQENYLLNTSYPGLYEKITITICSPFFSPFLFWLSAGVGRTGCFIVIDAMTERIKHEKTIDIYGHVTLMRSQRNYMVQTEDQYIFIHDALLEAVTCGNTEVPARNLYSYIQRLTQIEPGENVTGMELEFKVRTIHHVPEDCEIRFNWFMMVHKTELW